MPRYYITKYALANEGEPSVIESDKEPGDGRLYLKLPGHAFATVFTPGRDVFTDPAEARSAVMVARDKKIASLEKQIAKLRKIG